MVSKLRIIWKQTIEVAPADAEPTKTLVKRDGSGSTKAGFPSVIQFETFDKYGNRRKVGTEAKFTWGLKSGPDARNVINNRNTYGADKCIGTSVDEKKCRKAESELKAFTVEDGCDDRAGKQEYSMLSARYTAYRAGTFQFIVAQASTTVFVDTVRIVATKIDPAMCQAKSKQFATTEELRSNEGRTLTGSVVAVDVFPKDRYQNPLEDKVTFIVMRSGYPKKTAGYKLECYMDNKDAGTDRANMFA